MRLLFSVACILFVKFHLFIVDLLDPGGGRRSNQLMTPIKNGYRRIARLPSKERLLLAVGWVRTGDSRYCKRGGVREEDKQHR